MNVYLGIDVGSVSTNLVILGEEDKVLASVYIRTQGKPIAAIQAGMRQLAGQLSPDMSVAGAGSTGSARNLAGTMVGADIVKNEITAHAVAASAIVPEVQTIIEIGGQDSKIIILRDGVAADFAMNTVCAAGTGSFLDQQAMRLGIPIEEFGDLAVKARSPVRIAGRCAVFAESDMVHKQQLGHNLEDIVAGLCEALVRNYLNNVGKGKEILPPIVFQGGVAANVGIRRALEKALQQEVIVPPHYNVMGAIGAAILARHACRRSRKPTKFKGFGAAEFDYRTRSFECAGCENRCEVIQFYENDRVIARWGDRCGKWEIEAQAS